MRKLATITAFALALAVVPLTSASAATVRPQLTSPGPQWVYDGEYPMLSICYYVGNQAMFTGKYQAYTCLAGDPGQIALWVEPY